MEDAYGRNEWNPDRKCFFTEQNQDVEISDLYKRIEKLEDKVFPKKNNVKEEIFNITINCDYELCFAFKMIGIETKRTTNCIRKARYQTYPEKIDFKYISNWGFKLSELIEDLTYLDYLKIRNLGRKSEMEIKNAIASFKEKYEIVDHSSKEKHSKLVQYVIEHEKEVNDFLEMLVQNYDAWNDCGNVPLGSKEYKLIFAMWQPPKN